MPQKEIPGSQILESTLDFSGADGSTLTGVDAASLQTYTVGTSANNIIKLDGSSLLPAVDGSQLTNLPAAGIANVVEDLTPQLGGDLDINNKNIISPNITTAVSAKNIDILGGDNSYSGGGFASGSINLNGGTGSNGNFGANVSITAGHGYGGGSAGVGFLKGGNSAGSTVFAGSAVVIGGTAASGGTGGQAQLAGGVSSSTGAGGKALVSGGENSSTGIGGNVELKAGSAQTGYDSGSIIFLPGGTNGNAGVIEVHAAVNQTGEGGFQFWRDTDTAHTTGNYVLLKAGATLAADITLTLPETDGNANDVLQTDGAGILSFVAPSGLFTEDADRNIFGGTNAGSNLTAASAFDNFFGGFDAGAAMTTGDRNVMIGKDVGKTMTLGSDNVLIGYDIVNDNTGTNLVNAVIIGSGAAKYVTGSAHIQGNVIIGKNAGRGQNSSAGGGGDRNVFIGGSSTGDKANWTSGNENTFVGSNSGFALTIGVANTGLGWQALTDITDGQNNVGIGQWAALNVSTGDGNTCLGKGSGFQLTTGDGNVCLGLSAGPTTNQSNKLYIDNSQTNTPLIGGDFTANTVSISGLLTVSGGIDKLKSATTAVDVAAATAPTSGQVLTASSSTAAAWSSPFVNNLIINGNFDVWQRGTTFAAIAANVFCADRFRYGKAGAVVHTVNRSTDVPTVAQSGQFSNYSLHLDVTTADASLAAGDLCLIRYVVEGYDYIQLAGGNATLSFWVKGAKTGIHCVAFRNTGPDRSYVIEYTIDTADTWEKKTVTVPLTETGGTWDYINGEGLQVTFALSSGTTFHTTADAWQTGNFVATSGQVNETDNVANNFRIAQVQFERGDVATSFTSTNIRETISDCQRYFVKTYDLDVDPGTADVNGSISGSYAGAVASRPLLTWNLPVMLRVAPTATTFYSPNSGTSGKCYDVSGAVDRDAATLNTGHSTISFFVNATPNTNASVKFHITADAEL